MDFAAQLHVLEQAQGDPALLALALVDISLRALPDASRARVRDALLAAAVPHWCDSPLLATLLQTTEEEASTLLGHLRSLACVEPFPARGADAVNVHEASRLPLREHLRLYYPDLWQTYARHARIHLEGNPEPYTRIEALYHLFASDTAAAATECDRLCEEFNNRGREYEKAAFSLTLKELTTAGWLPPPAQHAALLASLWVRISLGETTQLEIPVREALALSLAFSTPERIAEVQCLAGDVHQACGHLDQALGAYQKCLAMFEDLAAQAPANVTWQHQIAIALTRVGGIHQAQGRRGDALAAYEKRLVICQHLTTLYPANSGWQRDLALAYSKVGSIREAEGRLAEALSDYLEDLGISQRLTAQDPENAGWQRRLAVAHCNVGDIYRAQKNFDEAFASYQKSITISQTLVSADQTPFRRDDMLNAVWQYDLGVAHAKLGHIHMAQDRVQDAHTSYSKSLLTCLRLAELNPNNPTWRRAVSLAHSNMELALRRLNRNEEALESHHMAEVEMEKALELSPDNAIWREDLRKLRTEAKATEEAVD